MTTGWLVQSPIGSELVEAIPVVDSNPNLYTVASGHCQLQRFLSDAGGLASFFVFIYLSEHLGTGDLQQLSQDALMLQVHNSVQHGPCDRAQALLSPKAATVTHRLVLCCPVSSKLAVASYSTPKIGFVA